MPSPLATPRRYVIHSLLIVSMLSHLLSPLAAASGMLPPEAGDNHRPSQMVQPAVEPDINAALDTPPPVSVTLSRDYAIPPQPAALSSHALPLTDEGDNHNQSTQFVKWPQPLPDVSQTKLAQPPTITQAIIEPAQLEIAAQPGDVITRIITVTTGTPPVPHLDVVFLFDASGTMSPVLNSAKANVSQIMNDVRTTVSDSNFAVGWFTDYPGSFNTNNCNYQADYGFANDGDQPFVLLQDITIDTQQIAQAIQGINPRPGGDRPEAYTRAIFETLPVPTGSLNWRANTKKVVVIFGDDRTHDCTFYGSSTGADPGRDGVVNTADDLVFTDVVAQLKNAGIVILPLYTSTITTGPDEIADTFQYMAANTGGEANIFRRGDDVSSLMTNLIINSTAKVNALSVQTDAPYDTWLVTDPTQHTDVGGGVTRSFALTFSIPADAPLQTHTFPLRIVGDGSLLGETTATINLPSLPSDMAFSSECPICSSANRTHSVGGPINTQSGNYNYETADLTIPTAGQPLRFERAYNSQVAEGELVYDRPMGPGWTHSYDLHLTLPHHPGGEVETVILKAPHGSRMRFSDNGDGTFTPHPGVWAEMTRLDQTYWVTTTNQTVYTFESPPQLTLTAPFTLAANRTLPGVAYNPVDDEYLVVLQENNGSNLFALRLDSAGNTLGSEITLSPTASGGGRVVFNPAANEYFVIWDDHRAGSANVNVFAQRLAADGSLLGGDYALTTDNFIQQDSQLAYDALNQTYLVVWQEQNSATSNAQIYGLLLNVGNGIPIPNGPKFQIHPATDNQRTPAVTAGNGEFLVVWTDQDPSGNDDIFGQRFSGSTGASLGMGIK